MLNERILIAETDDGPHPANLPEALSLLCEGRLIGFDGLAAHQRHAWDLFLFQTGAMALAISGKARAVEDDAAWGELADPAFWRESLAALTPECAETAWSLVVDDLARPAFMQPPIPAATLAGYSIAGQTPDEIDVLVTAKDHDVKAARAGAAQQRNWLFALVTLQTLQGYSGRGNFGIARMNGGFASRPLTMLTPGKDLPTRFRRGVQAALAAREQALELDGGYYRTDGLKLLWLKPWDSEQGLRLADLDPLFVEICRRIRLVRDAAGTIAARGRASETARVAVPKEAKGDLGDAWTPVNTAEQSALTVAAGGFDYRLLNRLLTSTEFRLPAAMRPPPRSQGALWLHAVVLVRGQGKTEGLHERWLPIPAAARPLMFGGGGDIMARLGKGMVTEADGAKTALRFGLLAFLQGGPEKTDFKDDRSRVWIDTLDQQIDRIFFTHLFARAADPDDEARTAQWHLALTKSARQLFDDATGRLDPPQCRRERAAAIASLTFMGMLRRAGLTQTASQDAVAQALESDA
jgi:CRISPR system Cascade subunit CasA